ncbi:MAG: hypothetical protein GF353_27395, partial [Candidatus Lokiarchaeota archaeon]|nr:hypothetical protein [Candidatus Lokiarchaeota archaeon]
MIENYLLILTSSFISIVAIYIILSRGENYGTLLNNVLLILIFLTVGILYFSLLVLSTVKIFQESLALTLWINALIIRIISMALVVSINSIIIKNNHVNLIAIFVMAFLGGLIVSVVLLTESISIKVIGDHYIFIFINPLLIYFILIFDLITIVFMWYIQIGSYQRIRNKKLTRKLYGNIIGFSIVIISNTLYYIMMDSILKIFFRSLTLVFYIITALLLLYVMVKKPELLIELTNKIYDLIIFHKSGVLLYSYSFTKGKPIDDSIIKGSILIGVSHILSNFSVKKDQLKLIKMKNHDI